MKLLPVKSETEAKYQQAKERIDLVIKISREKEKRLGQAGKQNGR